MPASPSRSAPIPWRLFENIALVLTMIGLWLFSDELQALSIESASRITTAIALGAAIIVVRGAPRRMWSPSAMFFIILLLFHVGLVAAYGLGRTPAPNLEEAAELWLYRPSTRTALWVTDLAAIGYAIGVRLVQSQRQAPAPASKPASANLDQILGQVGSLLVIGSVVAWFAIVVARGGPSLLVGSYREFLSRTDGSPLPLTDRLSYFGMVFIAASRWTRLHRLALFAFIVHALFAFPIGLRGEVLFPTFAALAVLASRRIPMRGSRAALWAIALLSAVAMIRDLRQVGVRAAGDSDFGVNPLDGLAEMGSSLRPVSEVVYWHDLGDPFDRGATYWAPVDRLVYYVVPGWTRVPIEQDPRMVANVVMDRAGPIGFSIIAEAYRNFSALGAMLILMAVGMVLGRIDTWSTAPVTQAAAGIIMTGLLLHVRNVFVPLPSHFLMGFGLLGALMVLARVRAERQARPADTPRRR